MLESLRGCCEWGAGMVMVVVENDKWRCLDLRDQSKRPWR